jgi:bifunctional DNA-binding transcriptional regulator/antitoxin component of YhaV-PrlF toxin-antitoxin module
MSKIRLEKLRRLTLPPEIIAQAGLRQDDVLEASYQGGAIILRPAPEPDPARPALSMMDYAGACKGAWGDTPAEVEFHVAQDRASWDR